MIRSSGSGTTPTLRAGALWVCRKTCLILISLFVSWMWTLTHARNQLAISGRTLQPVLNSAYPDISPDTFRRYAYGFRLSIVTRQDELILTPGPFPETPPPAPSSLQDPGSVFQENGTLYYLFPVHAPGDPQANVILTLPLQAVWPDFARRSALLLLIILAVSLVRRRAQIRQSVPGLQLLDEIEDLKSDSIDGRIRLPFDNPFQPVASTINQLLTSQERKDRSLSEQHHQQQVLLKNMSEGILTLDNDQRITGCNPAAARWLNLGNAQRIRGEHIYTICRIPKLLTMIEGVSSSGLQEEFLRLERPGSEDRIVKIKGSPLIDQDQTMGVLMVLQDVTLLRRLETLRQDFVSNVTHELRTPLTAIKGYAELMVDDPETSDETQAYLERILNQSTRMINIIEDLLSLTRVEDPEDSPSLVRTELRPIFESVILLCDEQVHLRDLSFRMECDEHVAADLHPALFEQAIHNLVYNAVKYTTAGTTIHLRALETDEGIRIEIQDQGPGIPEEDQSRIFERFYRVDKARSRAVGGTGLGLSIVKHITRMHGGSVGVQSIPGEGATFWLHLPSPEA